MLEPDARISQAVVALAAGYAATSGVLHPGKPRSLVCDIAALWTLDTVVPEASCCVVT